MVGGSVVKQFTASVKLWAIGAVIAAAALVGCNSNQDVPQAPVAPVELKVVPVETPTSPSAEPAEIKPAPVAAPAAVAPKPAPKKAAKPGKAKRPHLVKHPKTLNVKVVIPERVLTTAKKRSKT
jgi:hypothetical protein